MSGLDGLYQELILDHSKARDGFGLAEEEGACATSHQKNPICGDEITLRVRLDGDRIRDVTWEGAGCSISQASASMLTGLVDGVERDRATALIDAFREALRSRGKVELDEDDFGDAAALGGVSKFTARVKCAMLAWVALEDALARA
ncbi:Fe-S cluster assembly sulfur transfer protein SufU [Microbacterium sp. GXF7504]